MKSSYIRIRLIAVPANMEDVVTGHSFECGATGVTEALHFSQPDLTYDPDILHVRAHDMDVFFEETPSKEYFDQLQEWVPHLKWSIHEEEHKDWLAEWKKGFVPFQIVGPYWVVPSWLTPPPEAEKPIIIDPGMAFGTGTHATTKMAAYFVHKLCQGMKPGFEYSLIDVGTGTAILAMLAKMGGVQKVLGIEIDPEARRVARENIKLNNREDVLITDQLLETVHEQFDFVVANIIDGVLIMLKNDLLRVLKPGGQIFLTGILLEREDDFFAEFIEKSNLQVVRRIEKDEWVGFWLRSPEA
ncbi:MAG: 50S ribosomal protein L11 methyltransferase [Pseudobdellovibrionaceae bacterium]